MRQGRFQAPTLAVGARPWLQAPISAAPSICSEQTDVRREQRGLSKAYCTERPLRAAETLTALCMHKANKHGRVRQGRFQAPTLAV